MRNHKIKHEFTIKYGTIIYKYLRQYSYPPENNAKKRRYVRMLEERTLAKS